MEVSTTASIEYLKEHRDEYAERSGAERVDQVIAALSARLEQELAAFRAELTDESIEESAEEAVEDAGRESPELRAEELGGLSGIRLDLIKTRREVVIRERDAGRVDEEVMRRVLLGLDAEELAMDTSTGRYARR
jgi:CPA1 family monovalent cation:H+ antiporter